MKFPVLNMTQCSWYVMFLQETYSEISHFLQITEYGNSNIFPVYTTTHPGYHPAWSKLLTNKHSASLSFYLVHPILLNHQNGLCQMALIHNNLDPFPC